MPPFVETIIVVFTLIALGYGTAAARLLKPGTGDGMADFVFTVAIPLLLFRTIAHSQFEHGLPFAIWAAYFTAVLVTWTTAHLLIRRFFGRDTRGGVVAGVTAAFSNLLLIGFPLFSGVYGEAGIAVLSQILSIHLAIMMAASIILFNYAMRRDGLTEAPVNVTAIARGFFKQLLANPLIIGILAGLFVRLTGFPVPSIADQVIVKLTVVAGPLALFSMGMSLHGYGIRGQIPSSVLLVAMKLLFMPAIALAMALALGLEGTAAKATVVAASMPAGANTWLIATTFGTGQRLAATSMTIGTAAAALVTGLWIAIAEVLF